MKLHEEFKLYENMWDESKEIIGFIDCSGSNGSESILAAQQKVAKQLGVTSYYYFADKIYTSAQDATGYGTNYSAICTFAEKHTDKTIIVLTDEDIDHNPGGEALKKLPNVKIERIESHLKNINEEAQKVISKREESLTESRSVADIEAEISKLQQELEQAKIAEKKASYGGNFPKTVWTWDIYLEPVNKGTWTGIENDLVFETKDKALDAAWTLLNELDDEGELEYDPDDYYVEAFEVPLSSVSKEILRYSNLKHLI
jgi:hypothetical protein